MRDPDEQQDAAGDERLSDGLVEEEPGHGSDGEDGDECPLRHRRRPLGGPAEGEDPEDRLWLHGPVPPIEDLHQAVPQRQGDEHDAHGEREGRSPLEPAHRRQREESSEGHESLDEDLHEPEAPSLVEVQVTEMAVHEEEVGPPVAVGDDEQERDPARRW